MAAGSLIVLEGIDGAGHHHAGARGWATTWPAAASLHVDARAVRRADRRLSCARSCAARTRRSIRPRWRCCSPPIAWTTWRARSQPRLADGRARDQRSLRAVVARLPEPPSSTARCVAAINRARPRGRPDAARRRPVDVAVAAAPRARRAEELFDARRAPGAAWPPPIATRRSAAAPRGRTCSSVDGTPTPTGLRPPAAAGRKLPRRLRQTHRDAMRRAVLAVLLLSAPARPRACAARDRRCRPRASSPSTPTPTPAPAAPLPPRSDTLGTIPRPSAQARARRLARLFPAARRHRAAFRRRPLPRLAATAFFPGDTRFAGVDLQAGDVVTRVNGNPIERPEQLMEVWKALRTSKRAGGRGRARRHAAHAALDHRRLTLTACWRYRRMERLHDPYEELCAALERYVRAARSVATARPRRRCHRCRESAPPPTWTGPASTSDERTADELPLQSSAADEDDDERRTRRRRRRPTPVSRSRRRVERARHRRRAHRRRGL